MNPTQTGITSGEPVSQSQQGSIQTTTESTNQNRAASNWPACQPIIKALRATGKKITNHPEHTEESCWPMPLDDACWYLNESSLQ